MEKLIADLFLVISLVLGAGVSVKALHDKVQRLAIEKILKGQPSLTTFTKKLTRSSKAAQRSEQ